MGISRTTQWSSAAVLALSSVALSLAASDCSQSSTAHDTDGSPPDDAGGPADVSDAVPPPQEAGSCSRSDASSAACPPPPVDDSGAITDWPGWQRLPGLEPCCTVDRPVDLGAAGPPLTWRPCGEASVGCTELANIPPRGSGISPFIRKAHVTHDARGQPAVLDIRWALNPTEDATQDTIFDVQSGRVIAALRENGNNGPTCFAMLDVALAHGALLTQSDLTRNVAVARGTLTELTTTPSFQCVFTTMPGGTFPGTTAISDTAYAFELAGSGVIARTAASSNALVYSDGHPYLNLDFIEGDQVFARSDESLFWQEYTVLPDGNTVLYRNVGNRHVTAFRTDGTTMFWIESYGNPDPNGIPTTFEAWAAPYTPDSATLAATAVRIANVQSSYFLFDAAAFAGLYAVSTGTSVTVVRLSDRATRTISSPDPNVIFTGLQLVSQREVWAVMTMLHGPGSFALRRYDLGDW